MARLPHMLLVEVISRHANQIVLCSVRSRMYYNTYYRLSVLIYVIIYSSWHILHLYSYCFMYLYMYNKVCIDKIMLHVVVIYCHVIIFLFSFSCY